MDVSANLSTFRAKLFSDILLLELKTENTTMPIRYENLFNDPTPNGYINQRFVFTMMRIAQDSTDFTDEEFIEFVKELLLIAKKLVAVWKHKQRYEEIEDALIKIEENNEPIEKLDLQHISYSQDLALEVDEFLVQLKSTLDYLAKFPRAIIGNGFPYLHTFGDKGGAVIKAMKNNLPKKWEKHGIIVKDWLLVDHRPWLEMAIDARDKLNHYKDGGLDDKAFLVAKTTVNGKTQVIVPHWVENLTIREYLNNVWFNLFTLVEQFTVGFLVMRFKEGIGFVHTLKPRDGIISPFIIGPDEIIIPILQAEQIRLQKSKQNEKE